MNAAKANLRRPETTRMFESDFLEWFSRIHPATPFIAWIPVSSYVVYRSASRGDLSGLGIAGLFLLGVFAWTLAEYVLHRYVFHWTKDTPLGRRIHFLVHGVHHDFPNDKDRLVMPLGASIPLGVIFYALYYFTMGPRLGEPFFAGFVIGYLLYDGTHYAVHHFKQTTRIGKFLRRHHMMHHHADHDGGFGVSSPLWDLVFNTMPQPQKRKASTETPVST
ncbi:sterol desaturase family protein [Pendulispora albinea]|uniref:Sterol desaturase family protein n=1 Tax=Pendulispora albinea TaxID=2741071 RepID=A0ABZ2MCA1_9BACT